MYVLKLLPIKNVFCTNYDPPCRDIFQGCRNKLHRRSIANQKRIRSSENSATENNASAALSVHKVQRSLTRICVVCDAIAYSTKILHLVLISVFSGIVSRRYSRNQYAAAFLAQLLPQHRIS